MKRLSYISAAILMLTGALSCQKTAALQQEENVFTYTLSTKSDAAVDKIETCSVLVIRQRDSVVLASRTSAPKTGATSIADTFKNLPFENCIITAIANGNVIEEFTDSLEILKLAKGDKLSAAMFERVVNCSPDSIASRSLTPFSGLCELDIIKGKNCNLPMKRMLTALNVTVRNNSSSTRLVVDSIFFSDFKADRTYLFSHDGATPTGTVFTALKGRSCKDTIAVNSSSEAMSWKMFEGGSAKYELNLKLKVPETGAGVSVNNIPLMLAAKTGKDADILGQTKRGENINVTVNVYYDADGNIFKFSAGDWESETINQTIN